MHRKLINWLGLTGLLALISYTAAVMFSPAVYPGYNWMAQAVSDLSAESAPSRMLWNQLSAVYGKCSIVCATCVSVFVADNRVFTKLFRTGIHLFTAMNWVSAIGYTMFPLVDSGKEIASLLEIMHMVVTVMVVLLSIVSLILLIIAGCREKSARGVGIWAAAAFAMMMAGSVGSAVVQPQFFGIFERLSVFSATGFNCVLGIYLFRSFGNSGRLI